MLPQEIRIPDWYIDPNISTSLRYTSFEKYHRNASIFLIEKIRSHVRDVEHPEKDIFLNSYRWIKVPQFFPEGDSLRDLENLIAHHKLEVFFLMKKLRALVELS